MRSFEFYCEFIILTILALVAGNIWVRCCNEMIDHNHYSTETLLFFAIIFTVLAIFIIMSIFGEKNVSEKSHKLEMFEKYYDKFYV